MSANSELTGVNVRLVAMNPENHVFCGNRTLTLTSENNTAKIGRASSRSDKNGYEMSSMNGYFRNPVMSREHAQLSYRNKTVYLRDCNSFHGTAINGSRIPPNLDVAVNTNDVVTFAILTGRLAETMNAYSFTFKLDEFPDADPTATVTETCTTSKIVPGTYRAPTVVSEDESDMETFTKKRDVGESTNQARQDLACATSNLMDAGYTCRWQSENGTSSSASNTTGSDIPPSKSRTGDVIDLTEEQEGGYYDSVAENSECYGNGAMEEDAMENDEVPDEATTEFYEDQDEQDEEDYDDEDDDEDDEEDDMEECDEFDECHYDGMDIDVTQAGEVLEFVDLTPQYEYRPLDEVEEAEEEECGEDCHHDFADACDTSPAQALSAGSPGMAFGQLAVSNGLSYEAPAFAEQGSGHSISRGRANADRPTIPISSLLSPQVQTPAGMSVYSVESFLNPVFHETASSSGAQDVMTVPFSSPPSSPIMQKTTPHNDAPAFSAVTPSDSEEESSSSQKSNDSTSPADMGTSASPSGTKRKAEQISNDEDALTGIDSPFDFSCPVSQESAPLSCSNNNGAETQATETSEAYAESYVAETTGLGFTTATAEAPRSSTLKTPSRRRALFARPPVSFVGATNGLVANVSVGGDVQRPRKRLRKMAEAVGYAAIGGAAAGLAIVTTMIATAPDLI